MCPLSDPFGRKIEYLRVSVTDRCNLRCIYCMPPRGIRLRKSHEILRYEEIEKIVEAAVPLGISKVRITGGEPLARKGLVELIHMLSKISGLQDLTMTTNGTLLAENAQKLSEAGLRRVNISIDSLRPEKFRIITRSGELKDVFLGLEAAERAGLKPIKINVVVMRGVNDDELKDFASLTFDKDWEVRFIEFMPFQRPREEWEEMFVPAWKIRKEIGNLGQLAPLNQGTEGGIIARNYTLPGAKGIIGFISPISEPFCASCNRLRLTADGKLIPCLLSGEELDIKTILRSGANRNRLAEVIQEAVSRKPKGHNFSIKSKLVGATEECLRLYPMNPRPMSQIGG